MPLHLARGVVPLTTALAVISGCLLPASTASAAGSGADVAATAARSTPTANPDLAAEWWLAALGVPQAWSAFTAAGSRARPGAGVTVAVLSTGVDAAHPDLAGDVITGPDYSGSGASPGDPFWGQEGTAVASLIAAHGHGARDADGITGVAPGARILSLRVTLEYNDPRNANHSITSRLTSEIAAGIKYAVSHGASVIALPLDPGTLDPLTGGDPTAAGGSAAERAAVRAALAANVVLVAPAGDNAMSAGTVNYPAAYPGVIAVGATGRNGHLEPFSSRRSRVALSAPGGGLTVAAPGGGYGTISTTDMSAALVAGVAALVRARYPRLSAAQIAEAIEKGTTSQPAGTAGSAGAGAGALNAAQALRKAASLAATLPLPGGSATGKPSAAGTAPAALAASARSGAENSGLGDAATSVLRDAAIGAGVLIVALAALLLLTRSRRRPTPAARELVRASRTATGRATAGHPNAGHPTRAATGGFPAITSGLPALSSHGVHAAGRGSHASTRSPATDSQQAVRGNGPRRALAAAPGSSATGARTAGSPALSASPGVLPSGTARPRSRSSQIAQTGDLRSIGLPAPQPARTYDTPPWEPARMPADATPALPAPTPPILLRPAQAGVLPPWEQDPGSLAQGPNAADIPSARRNTGPMYIWNPGTNSGPFPAINED